MSRCVLLGVALALAGCASNDELAAKPAPLVAFTPGLKPKVEWQYVVGKNEFAVLQPKLLADRVVVANSAGRVTALNRETGKPIWQVKAGFTVIAGLGGSADSVYLGGSKGEVLALSAEDGKIRWQARVSSEVVGVPFVGEDKVVVRTGDGRLVGLSQDKGERVWQYERMTPALVARSGAGVTGRGEEIFVGLPAGKLVALKLGSGILEWEASVSQPRGTTELERISDIVSLPVWDNERICAMAFQGRVSCFELDHGAPLWTREFASDRGMAIYRRHLALIDAQGELVMLDKTSGNTLWKTDSLHDRGTSSPWLGERWVVVGDAEGYLHIYARETGELQGRVKLGGAIVLAPAGLDDSHIMVTSGDRLFRVAIE